MGWGEQLAGFIVEMWKHRRVFAPGKSPRASPCGALGIILEDIGRSRNGRQLLASCPDNICTCLVQIFHYLSAEKDVELLGNTVGKLLKVEAVSDLKRISFRCPILPPMIRTASRCTALYEHPEELKNASEDTLKNLCSESLKLCCHTLLPLTKRVSRFNLPQDSREKVQRSRENELPDDTAESVQEALATFAKVLRKTREGWWPQPSSVLGPLIEMVARAVREQDLHFSGVLETLEGFASEIPPTIEVIWEEHPAGFKETVQKLFGDSGNANSPLVDLWTLLMSCSSATALPLLCRSLEKCLSFLLEDGGRSRMVELGPGAEEAVVKFAQGSLAQCCVEYNQWDGWNGEIRPLIRRCIMGNRMDLGRETYELLVKMLVCIDSLKITGRCFRPPDRLPIELSARMLNTNGTVLYPGQIKNISKSGCRLTIHNSQIVISQAIEFANTSSGLLLEVDIDDDCWRVAVKGAVAPHELAPEKTLGYEFVANLSDDQFATLRSKAGGVLL